MDKVKAIKVLKPLVDSYVDYANISMKEEDDDIVEALEMAIEALKALDVPDTNVGDMISRQMAIDAMKDMYRAAEKWLRDATDDVTKARAESCMASLVEIKLRTEKLPVVQPDHVADVSKKVDEDCISRQAAIDSLHGYFDGMLETDTWSPCDVYGLIELLPSAQPEQVCVANVTLTDEQVKEAVEKAKNAVISVIEPEPHWIPCSERLPEENGQYLITIK